MANWTYKQSFTAGEISPLLQAREDRDWYAKACLQLSNFVLLPQGPVIRRPGLKFIYDLSSLFTYPINVRQIPFIFSTTYAYSLLFVEDKNGVEDTLVLFAYQDGLIEDPNNPGTPLQVTLNAVYDVSLFDYAQSYSYLILVHPNMPPSKLIRTAHDNWTFSAITFTDFPLTDSSYYPTAVTFHDQRLVLAAPGRMPTTVYMSKAGDLFTFTPGGLTPTDDSAVTFTLASGRQNAIQWVLSGDGLLIGTTGDEWRVTGSDGGFITPSSILAKRQTAKGSTKHRPIFAGTTCFFLERHAKTINSFFYSMNDNGFQTSDVRILAEHLTRTNTITQWTYQQAPISILWCATADGTLLSLTYEKEHKITAWSPHTTDGKVRSVCALPLDGTDRLWTVVERVIEGNTVQYLELMDTIKIPTEVISSIHLDSYLAYTGTLKQSFSGLQHLAGKTVGVLTDGARHPDIIVPFSGDITLDYAATNVYVGLLYSSTCEPFIDSASQDSITRGKIQRITQTNILIINSLLFEYGTSEDTMELEAFRSSYDATGAVEPLFSGIKSITWPGSYDLNPRLIIRQQEPFPLNIVGLINKVEVYS